MSDVKSCQIPLSTSVFYSPQKMRVSTICPEAGKEAVRSGFGLAKALRVVMAGDYRYPNHHPFETILGYLPVL